jgi:hypothetical protein
MTREILDELAEGARDALQLYAAIITAPFAVAKAFVMRTPGTPFERTRSGGHARSVAGDTSQS